MKPISITDLYRAKEERRARLARLPIDEKVRIMEELQDMGRTLRAARRSREAFLRVLAKTPATEPEPWDRRP